MQGDSRNSTFARVGRSYPRQANPNPNAAAHPRARFARYRVVGALIVVFSALGLLGWLFAR